MSTESKTDTTVLIIDDAEENCNLLKYKLEKGGYKVETATDGQEGLLLLSRRDIDIVLLDLIMPVMNGFTFLEKIKSNEKYADIPVVITSSLDDESTARDCIKFGAKSYLFKPYNINDVLTTIKENIS